MTAFTPIVTGSFAALNTPMNGDFSIDHPGFGTLLDFQREAGTSAVLIMGSSGEVSMLSPDERRTIVRSPGLDTAYDYRAEPVLAAE